MQQRLLSLFLLCFISGPSFGWSQDQADEEPVGTQPSYQNTELPTSPAEPANASPPAKTPSPSVFLHGYHAFQNKDWAAARTAFEHVQQPILADYSLYFLGKLHLKADRRAEARGFLEQLLDDYPTTVWQSDAALALAQLTFAEERWERTVAYARQAQRAPLATEAVRHQSSLLIAQAYERQGALAPAYQRYQALRASVPRTAIGKAAKARVAGLREQYPKAFPLQTAQAYYNEARLLLKEGDVETAQNLTEQFQTRFSTSSLRPDGLLLLAGIYKSQGRREAAIEQWQEIVERYPRTALAPKALYHWARFFWNQDEDDAALPLFKRLTTEYPRQDLAAEAWYAMGRIFQSKRDNANAASAYQHLKQQFSRAPLAREAHWQQGWMAYSQGEYRTAQNIFQKLAQSVPGTAEGKRALYWQARATGRLGQSEGAASVYRRILRRYPHDYYALWAEKRLGTTLSALPRKPLPTSPPPLLSAVQTMHYQRCTTLADLGLLNLARRELDFVRHLAPKGARWTKFFISEYQRLNDHTSVFQLIQQLKIQSAVKQAYFYPQAYWDVILAHAEKNGIDPYLIVALIRQESLFDAAAVSPANAYGLMQLLPTTAAQLTDLPLNDGSALTDPAFNIRLGTAYLRGLLKRYQGSVILALSAYNAGEKAADKWRSRSGHLEPDEFIENISYGETRQYVKLVLRNYRTYIRMYGKGATVSEIRLP